MVESELVSRHDDPCVSHSQQQEQTFSNPHFSFVGVHRLCRVSVQ